MKKYDLHIHSHYSTCSSNSPETILKVAKKRGLDGIAVTDHNTIKGALFVKKLNKDRDFEVIVGEEIKTPVCEILAYHVNEEIKPGPLGEVLDKLHDQGCITSIAHPFTLGVIRRSVPIDLRKLIGKVDAIETFNGRMFTMLSNMKARTFALENGFAQTGGSDAHFAWEIGRGWTVIEDSLERDISARNTLTGGKFPLGIISRQLSLPVMLSNELLASRSQH